jgi:hypothetical protein
MSDEKKPIADCSKCLGTGVTKLARIVDSTAGRYYHLDDAGLCDCFKFNPSNYDALEKENARLRSKLEIAMHRLECLIEDGYASKFDQEAYQKIKELEK